MYSTKFAITYSRAQGRSSLKWIGPMCIQSGLVQCAFNLDWLNVHSIRIGSMRIQSGLVQCAFNPDWFNVHSIRIGSMCIQSGLVQCAFNPDWFNAHSVWTQPMRIECAFDVQCGCGQAFSLVYQVQLFLNLIG